MLLGQQNDARMNLAIGLTAAREGATITNHVEVLSLIKEKGIVKGATVRDTLNGDQWEIYAKVVINATGHLPLSSLPYIPIAPSPLSPLPSNILY